MPFPLQSLPDPALKHILRCMTPLELLAISVLSTKYSGLVKSLKIRADDLKIILEENVTFDVTFQNGRLFVSFPNAVLNDLDQKPGVTKISYLCRCHVWMNLGVKLRTYLECISRNFEWKDGIQIYFWTEHEVLNMEALSKCFVSVTSTVIDPPCSVEYARKILKYFGPVTKCIKHYNELFRDKSSLIQSFLISNYDEFLFTYASNTTLENLLSFNAESIYIFRSDFTLNDVHQFIKLWMKGCNPRLKILYIPLSAENEIYDQNIVLKGIQYQEVGEDVERQFMWQRRWREVIKGGYNITSRNGRRATVHMNQMGIECRILFLVWD